MRHILLTLRKSLSAFRFNCLCGAMVSAIYGGPAIAAWLPIRLLGKSWILVGILFAPMFYAFAFAITAGLLSRRFIGSIIAGKFPRDLTHPIYRKRRYYG